MLFCMDDFFIHLAPQPRRMPCMLPVESIGYDREKKDWVDQTFTTFNFSFILSGGGSYTWRGETQRIEAPCVITQWPGEPVRYGPGGEWSTWEELFIIYSADCLDELARRQLALERKPVWNVRRPEPMREQLSRLLEFLEPATSDPDRIDRACEALIVESRLGESRPPMDRNEAVIRTIREYVRRHYLEHHDYDALARAHGLSPITFRRHWDRYVHTPPARYVTHLRMREACRMLAETDGSVAEIAHILGFSDPLYFSRRFKAAIGVPATTYRRMHQAAAHHP